MTGTTARALALLNLLQRHRHWRGSDLAARLGVTQRTVRRDIDRLRDLGYRVESTPGSAGGYRLEAGSAVPPLLLTDDEAVTMAIGLRIAAAQQSVGDPEVSLTALAKLEQVLPSALRRRVNALASSVHSPRAREGSIVSPAVLGELALAARDRERIRVRYTDGTGRESTRRIEPHALAPADHRWFLLCWDLDRDDWRTFRVDRIESIDHTRVIFTPRDISDDEVAERLLIASSWAPQRIEADVVMELSFAAMNEYFGVWAQGATREGAAHTRWPIGGSDWRDAFYGMTWIPAGVEFATDLPEPARSELREMLERALRALEAPPPLAASGPQPRR